MLNKHDLFMTAFTKHVKRSATRPVYQSTGELSLNSRIDLGNDALFLDEMQQFYVQFGPAFS